MGGFLENFNVQSLFEGLSGGEYTAKAGTGWKAAAQAAPALLAGFQAAKAKRDYGIKVAEIETFMNNREDIKNPYANITNPFQNLAVATEGARFQAEQADIALANTLDSVRQAGGAGATALAQAALQSKRGVSISIEKQEANNQKLQAQGQLKVDSLKGQGELNRQVLQFRRDQDDLSELRNEADQLKAQQIVSRQQAAAGLGATFDALSSGIVPTQVGEGDSADLGSDLNVGGFVEDTFGGTNPVSDTVVGSMNLGVDTSIDSNIPNVRSYNTVQGIVDSLQPPDLGSNSSLLQPSNSTNNFNNNYNYRKNYDYGISSSYNQRMDQMKSNIYADYE